MTDHSTASLRRALGLWPLVLYGLGTIIGAGIFVLLGEVAGRAGMATPFSFILAGGLAALTGLSYAELAARHPEAAGAAAYVKHAFGSNLFSRLVGAGVAASMLIAAASIAHGSAAYLQQFIAFPAAITASLIVILFTVVACLGVRESVGIAALLSLIEIGGLVFVIAVGLPEALETPERLGAIAPAGGAAWLTVAGGAFLAFFAFIGFESLVNMAEETKDVGRTLPRAILISIGVATILYVLTAFVAVMVVPLGDLAGSTTGLLGVVAHAPFEAVGVFSAVAVIATVNGVLIEIIVVSRLGYGMARRGLVPAFLGVVHPLTQTPVRATVLTGAVVLALVVTLSFAELVRATSAVTLAVFIAVNLALWRLKRRDARPDIPLRTPAWTPPLAAAACIALIAIALFG